MEQCSLKNVNSCWKTKISSYLETSGGQNFNLLINVANIFNTGGLYYKHITILNDDSRIVSK
jgi:hypothetical protein